MATDTVGYNYVKIFDSSWGRNYSRAYSRQYEQASAVTTEYGSLPKWASWLATVVGLWVLVSPFVLSGSVADGTPMWSNVVAGGVAFILAAYVGYFLHFGG